MVDPISIGMGAIGLGRALFGRKKNRYRPQSPYVPGMAPTRGAAPIRGALPTGQDYNRQAYGGRGVAPTRNPFVEKQFSYSPDENDPELALRRRRALTDIGRSRESTVNELNRAGLMGSGASFGVLGAQESAGLGELEDVQSDVFAKRRQEALGLHRDTVGFDRSMYAGDVDFDRGLYQGDTEFDRRQYEGDVAFGRRQNERDTDFGRRQYEGDIDFDRSNYQGDVGFERGNYADQEDFRQSQYGAEGEFNRRRALMEDEAGYRENEMGLNALGDIGGYLGDDLYGRDGGEREFRRNRRESMRRSRRERSGAARL